MFRQVSFEYACRLQDVHAMKHYELIEPVRHTNTHPPLYHCTLLHCDTFLCFYFKVVGYISDVTTFLHQSKPSQ